MAKEKKALPDGIEESYYELKISLLEPMLGTVPKDTSIYGDWVLAKREEGQKDLPESEKDKDDETLTVDTVGAEERKGWTGFHWDQGGPFIYNYMVKGFLKNAAKVLRQQSGISALQSKVTNFVYVRPRRVHFDMADAMQAEELVSYIGTGEATAKIGPNGLACLERPLRAETMRGPRVSLARSDVIGGGTVIRCVVKLLKNPEITEKVLRYLLQYGENQGLGQWRNADWGSFEYELEKCDKSRIKELEDVETIAVATAAD